ncbi:MAG: hypothetical protein LAO78_18885 [Acidobacteriia bacterium]|nr:hypothetical protein [Terriglobia bacterium]
MTATLLYRIAAVVFVLFAAGHTVGFLKFKPANAEGVAVHDAMNTVRLHVGSGKLTYGDFYRGFGLFCTLYLLFAAYLAWFLGGLAQNNPQAIGALGWVFFMLQLASIIVSWIYFLPPPVILSALVAVCTGWAAWLVSAVKP